MLRLWMYDLAREQSPTLDHLRKFCQTTLDGGYDGLGLYLEHRFAYPSSPWSAGRGAVTPEMVSTLQEEFPSLQLIPFINLLGHMEGFLYTEAGSGMGEERFKGMQACPSDPQYLALCHGLIADICTSFKSEIIHIGGDETADLGRCPRCAASVAEYESAGAPDGKAELYRRHFAPLAEAVIAKGRRPAVWGDMFEAHPSALGGFPKQTLIFDWRYFGSPEATSRKLMEAGFDVICCPTLLTYNAAWLHLKESAQNVADHIQAAEAIQPFGICLTTWEQDLFGNYETLLPAVIGAGKAMSGDASNGEAVERYMIEAYGEHAQEWVRLIGHELPVPGTIFGYSEIRSAFKCRFLLYSNPFLLWLRHREELCGEVGEAALALAERAIFMAPTAPYRGVSEFVKAGIEFVRHVEASHQAHASNQPGVAVAALAPARQIFENLSNSAKASHLRIGGSLADIERCRTAREHVEKVMLRIKQYGDGSLGYLPSFETISHPKFVPHDQGNWWLINSWANE